MGWQGRITCTWGCCHESILLNWCWSSLNFTGDDQSVLSLHAKNIFNVVSLIFYGSINVSSIQVKKVNILTVVYKIVRSIVNFAMFHCKTLQKMYDTVYHIISIKKITEKDYSDPAIETWNNKIYNLWNKLLKQIMIPVSWYCNYQRIVKYFPYPRPNFSHVSNYSSRKSYITWTKVKRR